MSSVPVYKLNQKQHALLHELYRFRNATIQQLANELNIINLSLIHKRMDILMKYDLVDRRYDSSYKLLHKPATYNLSKKGVKILRAKEDTKYSNKVLSNISRTSSPTEKYIKTSIGVFDIHNLLKAAYKDKLTIYTSSETATYPYFPKKRPDLYLQLQSNQGLKQYFLIYLESNLPMYVNIRRIKDYGEYISEGEWDVTNTPSPTLLIVCDYRQLQKRLISAIYNISDDIDNELDILIAPKSELIANLKTTSWTNIFEPDDTIFPFK